MKKIELCQLLVQTKDNIRRPWFNKHKKAVAARAEEIVRECLSKVKVGEVDPDSIKCLGDIRVFAAITAGTQNLTPNARCQRIKNVLDPEACETIYNAANKALMKF